MGWISSSRVMRDVRDTSPVLGGEQENHLNHPHFPLFSSPPPTPASESEIRVAFLLRLAGFAGWNFHHCCLLEKGCPKREMNKGSFRTDVAMASRVGLSMGQIGIADPQNEVDGLESDKIWQDRELTGAVSTSNHSAELTVISKGVPRV